MDHGDAKSDLLKGIMSRGYLLERSTAYKGGMREVIMRARRGAERPIEVHANNDEDAVRDLWALIFAA